VGEYTGAEGMYIEAFKNNISLMIVTLCPAGHWLPRGSNNDRHVQDMDG